MWTPNRKPDRWRRGERSIPARKLNQPVEILRTWLGGVGAGRQINPSAVAVSPEIRQFKIRTIAVDYLECVPWDGVTEGENLTYIAKPPTLRGSVAARDGVTYSGVHAQNGLTRTATLGAATENQIVVPNYLVGDVVMGARNVKGGVGVSRTVAGKQVALLWVDLNVDGRQWAKV